MPEKCDLGDNIAEDSPQDASATPSRHPKSTKNHRKSEAFQCFSLSRHGAKIDHKRSQNHPRSFQVESKMAVLPLSWSILELMLAHLGALAHHLACLVRHLGADMASNSKQNAIFEPTSSKTAPKMPQPPLASTPKVQKTKENLWIYNVFHSPAMVPKSIKNAPNTASETPRLSPKWQSCR